VHGHRYVCQVWIKRALTNPRPDFGDKKITVNAIAPGGIKTDMYHAVCREYIPGGDKLDNEGVDEVSPSPLPQLKSC
jgi:NAD(P)-dependent dehydrogenase (short-subunit alcohol dehydrogenase family)